MAGLGRAATILQRLVRRQGCDCRGRWAGCCLAVVLARAVVGAACPATAGPGRSFRRPLPRGVRAHRLAQAGPMFRESARRGKGRKRQLMFGAAWPLAGRWAGGAAHRGTAGREAIGRAGFRSTGVVAPTVWTRSAPTAGRAGWPTLPPAHHAATALWRRHRASLRAPGCRLHRPVRVALRASAGGR